MGSLRRVQSSALQRNPKKIARRGVPDGSLRAISGRSTAGQRLLPGFRRAPPAHSGGGIEIHVPFDEPYKTTYEAGELVYGLGKPRGALMSEHFKLSGPNIRTVDLSTINNYATTGDEKGSLDSKLKYARGWDDPMKKAAREEMDRFNTSLKSHGKYGSAVDWQGTGLKGSERDRAENRAWRQKCKGGLYYACFIAKTHIHFCLEGVNCEQVVKKSFVDREGTPIDVVDKDGKFRAITNAELRWLYRNRDHVEVSSRVQFWRKEADWVACAPPWTGTGEKLWSQYQPRRRHNVHGRAPEDDAPTLIGDREPQPYSGEGVGRKENPYA